MDGSHGTWIMADRTISRVTTRMFWRPNTTARHDHAKNAFSREMDRIQHAVSWGGETHTGRPGGVWKLLCRNQQGDRGCRFTGRLELRHDGGGRLEHRSASGRGRRDERGGHLPHQFDHLQHRAHQCRCGRADRGSRSSGRFDQRLAGAAKTFATDISTAFQTTMTSWVSGLGAAASDYATYLSSSMAATSAESSAVLGRTMTYIGRQR